MQIDGKLFQRTDILGVALSELHLQASLHCLKSCLLPSPTHIQNTSFGSSCDRVEELSTVCLNVSPSLKFIRVSKSGLLDWEILKQKHHKSYYSFLYKWTWEHYFRQKL